MIINNIFTALSVRNQICLQFKCCGVLKPDDWLNINSTHNRIPNSCCDRVVGEIYAVECNLNSTALHTKGCLDSFGDFIKNHTYKIEAAGLGIAFVQVMTIDNTNGLIIQFFYF